jgi:hypothetical protein
MERRRYMTNENELRDYLERLAANLRRTRRCLREIEERHPGPVAVVGMGPRGLGPALTTWRRGDRGGPVAADWRYRVTWLSADAGAGALPGTWLLVGPELKRFRDVISQCTGAMAARGAQVDTMLVDCGTANRDVLGGLLEGALDGERLTGVVSFLGLNEAPAVLALIQALGDEGITVPLWLVAHEAPAPDPNRGDALDDPQGEFGARAAALLCSVFASAEPGLAAPRPLSAQGGRRRHAVWPAEAHRERFGSAGEAAPTPAQR